MKKPWSSSFMNAYKRDKICAIPFKKKVFKYRNHLSEMKCQDKNYLRSDIKREAISKRYRKCWESI